VELTFAHGLSGVPQGLRDVINRQVGQVIDHLGRRHPVGDHGHHCRDGNAQTTDGGQGML
jgi:hypothetical protein